MKRRGLVAWGALLPLALIVCVGYVGTVLWTLRTSVSSSRTFPSSDFVMTATFAPTAEASMAARSPAPPAPITSTSCSCRWYSGT